jgi:hypothetical protein
MAKISFTGWKDPIRRPRFIIWTGVGVLLIALIMVLALGATSTYWFCASICHKVQDDSIIAYNRSTHSQVSCMSCHEPVNANVVVFILAKAEALGELYLTVTNKYELPLNAESHYSLELTSERCTQCHSKNRVVTPTNGIIINHEIHAEKEVQCTYCHNRIAHNENFELTLKNPNGEDSHKHANFMTMTACFRCHEQPNDGLERPLTAPGTCTLCHPSNFQLKPASHFEASFYPKGHADLAKEAIKEAAAGEALAEEGKSEEGGAEESEPLGMRLPTVESVDYCLTCHDEKAFCEACHGMLMPHPTAFLEPASASDPAGHPAISKTQGAKCEFCHQAKKTDFCNKCHHGTAIKWDYVTKTAWQTQHAAAVDEVGIPACTDKCHTTTFCSNCHNKLKPLPSSHKQATWLHNKVTVTSPGKEAARPTALHATNATNDITTCQICHGKGDGANAAFCKACHKVEMPHPDQFKQFHSKTGNANPKLCQSCHQFKEICSNCHHLGASLSKPWLSVHGASVAKNSATGCVEKCHTKKDCVACHTSRKVVPASHAAKNFVRRTSLSTPAKHTELYKSSADSCTYCHSGADPNTGFCKNCHKLEMPHPIDDSSKEKFLHKNGFAKKTLTKAQCSNCHVQFFCDNCHHPGAVANKPWRTYHPTIVKKTGASPCFECHQETFCSHCHVNLNK